MVELTCVKVQLVHVLFLAEEEHGNPQSLCKTGLKIHASPRSVITVRKVGHNKSRPSYLCHYGVVYLAEEVVLTVALPQVKGYRSGAIASRR